MTEHSASVELSTIPSVDKILRTESVKMLINKFGRPSVIKAVREDLEKIRHSIQDKNSQNFIKVDVETIIERINARLISSLEPSLKAVFNLTGTVIHTNLGRAPLPSEAIDAMAAVSEGASNLEYNLKTGKRGDRDSHLEKLLIQLTGAEAVTVVNNNAAAVLLILNSLALRKEVIVSRGELVEIGGAFRIPEIMTRAGAKLKEVGTTNRSHARDYKEAISKKTAMLMKVHTSNYEVTGFTSNVTECDLAKIAQNDQVPFVIDLGSGTMVNLEKFGLPHEPTVQEALSNGADLVSFSGDKLLGGPQAGVIAGRKELIAKIKKNPMKRAMRCDKMTIAALTAILKIYSNPKQLCERIPTLRLLTRDPNEIHQTAKRIIPALKAKLGKTYSIKIEPCQSQIGSGALPTEKIPSVALKISLKMKRGSGKSLNGLSKIFRELPKPVIGRIQDNAFWMDLRCLEKNHEDTFLKQLNKMIII
ncbi:MAG: L-seryl-tRNA(Sec) selenium transferase [Rhodospirillales bacterium]|nr:L-seryl-tRNA(Sec) selenium transferase [Rhodospirillales bacterium]|tara:strand:- start:4484 stop:5911 length:1428 start_codon:yes stop_codon:yes gene_type:complete